MYEQCLTWDRKDHCNTSLKRIFLRAPLTCFLYSSPVLPSILLYLNHKLFGQGTAFITDLHRD